MLKKTILLLTAAVGLMIASNSQADDPVDRGPKPEEAAVSKNLDRYFSSLPGYHFQKATVSEGEYQGQPVWVVDCQFTALNGFGLPIPCHALAYVHYGVVVGATKPISYFQERQEQEEKKAQEYREKLIINITNTERSEDMCTFMAL
jgi:hypothetical protein